MNKELIASIYTSILESYIIFVLFAIFFYVLIRYIITPYQLEVTSDFAIKQLEFYGLPQLVKTKVFNENIEEVKRDLSKSEQARQDEVDSANEKYYNTQLIIFFSMIVGIALFLSIPLLFGIIKINAVDWKHLLYVLIINLIIILIVEVTFIFVVIGEYSTIRFYPSLQKTIS